MISVSIKQLISAIEEADEHKMPAMSAGTIYIYNQVYIRLAQETEVKLSEIDWSAFEIDDINAIRNLHSSWCSAGYKSRDISRSLLRMEPAVVTTAYI